LGFQVDKSDTIVVYRENNPFKDLEVLRGILAKDEPNGVNAKWVDQVFTLQTTLVGVDVAGQTKDGALYRIEAVVERFHPPRESTRWRCRFLRWREYPGQGLPAPAVEPESTPTGSPNA
jgi:hypothetical protein